ncbi:MAG: hypothetical protein ABIW03_04115 [Sphingomicrobium sp.]
MRKAIKWLVFACAAIASLPAGSAAAADFTLNFAPGQGKILQGRGGLQVFDVKTAKTLMRVIAPGNRITKLGTVRVLVMNLGQPAFRFGPDQVRIELPGGTQMKAVPVAVFDRGQEIVEREVRIAGSIDRAVKSNLGSYTQSQNGGMTASSISGSSVDHGDQGGQSSRMDRLSDNLPGAKLLGSLDQVLRPLRVGPNEAWGGYVIFTMPEPVQKAQQDQHVTIVVQTGQEVHRVQAVFKRM